MLRWGKGGDKQDEKEPQPAPEEAADEWAFLRAQPDHDADEMAAVRSDPATSDPAGEEVGDEWAFRRAQPDLDAASPDRANGEQAPRRRPADEPAAVSPEPGGFSEQFALEADPPREAGGEPAPRLVLKLTVAGRSRIVTVEKTSLIGRSDPEIGLHAAIDLAEDSEVARCHALLRLRQERFHLVDLGSAGGTLWNGERLAPDLEVRLSPGDQIELGRLVQLSVGACDTDPDLTEEDLLLADMAGEMLDQRQDASPAEEGIGGDILDIALERGRAAGLLPPERPGEGKP